AAPLSPPARGRPTDRRRWARTAPSPQHLHLVADNLGRIALVALLILPLASAQTALNVDLRALAQVLGGDLGQPAEERHAVPFGTLLLLAALLVAPALAGGDAQVGDGRARGHGAGLGVGAEIADQDHFVHSARHGSRPPSVSSLS